MRQIQTNSNGNNHSLMRLLITILLATTLWTDSVLMDAYQREDMSVWKGYVDSFQSSVVSHQALMYEYGYCGYIVAEAKKEGADEALMQEAKRRVAQFKKHVEEAKASLPTGHYEMYLSAVYVYELRVKESIHPLKAMSLAKEATKLAPEDPVVLSYYGTCLFYAPKPFGSKEEALQWFERAKPYFETDDYRFHWMREANEMYIRQCLEKLKKN